MTSPFGAPFPSNPTRSLVSTMLVEPTLGFDVSHSALNLPNGATPNSDNFVMRDGRLEQRPVLSAITDVFGQTAPLGGSAIKGGTEVVTVAGNRFLLVSPESGAAQLFWMQGPTSQWQTANFSGAGVAPPASATGYWDWTQIFDDAASENVAVGGFTARTGLYAWQPGSPVYSALTGAPGARAVCAYDNYLLAANVTDTDGGPFIQRVRWNDRGSASSWTGGLSGFEDLLAAKGGISRLMPLESSVAVLFEDEVWLGVTAELPSVFRFTPLDKSVGCPYPMTAVNTPRGVMFMARNYQLYLLPKQGGAAQPIGQQLHRSIRDAIASPAKAWAVYDNIREQYQLYYPVSGVSGGIPHNAAYLQLATGAWAPQSFASSTASGGDLGLTYGFGANIASSGATSWDAMVGTWNAPLPNATWDEMLGIGNERQTIVLGSSAGTLYQPDSTATLDASKLTVTSVWESNALGAEWPQAQKLVTEIRADYRAPSASSLTLRALQGLTYSAGTQVAVPAASAASQVIAYTQTPSRYAAIRVETDSRASIELHRFFVTMRVGGR